MRRHDLSDAEWARLEPLPPRYARPGHRWNDHRLVINGIFFRTRTGCPSRDLPDCFGKWRTVNKRHRRWSGGGTWEMILDGCEPGEMSPQVGLGGRGGREGGAGAPARGWSPVPAAG